MITATLGLAVVVVAESAADNSFWGLLCGVMASNSAINTVGGLVSISKGKKPRYVNFVGDLNRLPYQTWLRV